MQREMAETLAINALGWLAGDPEMLGHFMGTTGASAEDLRRGAQDPAFLVSVLSFIALDDAWVLAWAEASGERPETLLIARQSLPGGEEVAWT